MGNGKILRPIMEKNKWLNVCLVDRWQEWDLGISEKSIDGDTESLHGLPHLILIERLLKLRLDAKEKLKI